MKRQITAFLFSTLLAFISGCGGGSGGLGPLADGGIGGTGISLGSISGFGSIIINGKRFETTNATQIIVEGQPASEQDLKVGFVVRLEGDFINATAARIEFAETVLGPIESIVINNPDALQATLSLLGQTVQTNALTNLANVDLTALSPGDNVAISGNRDAQGNIIASYLERDTVVTEFRVMGPVSNLVGTSFNISGLKVDFGSANLNQGVPGEGEVVRVKGASADFTNAPPTLKASSVQPGITLAANPDDKVELEGIVTQFVTLGNFRVNGQGIDASSAKIENGIATDIKENVRLEVEGNIDSNGILQAVKVDIKPDNPIRIDANVETVNASDSSLTLLGISVMVDEFTRFEDKSDIKLSPFDLGNINVGDRTEMRGFLDGSNLTASRLERADTNPNPDEKVELQAPLEASNATGGTVTLLGITVPATTALGTQFEDENDNSISQAAFYAALTPGTLVKVKWDPFTSTTAPADEVSLESQ